MSTPSLTADLLKDLTVLICNPYLSDDKKCEAITIAYELGKSDGRVEGAESMGKTWTESMDKAINNITAKLRKA